MSSGPGTPRRTDVTLTPTKAGRPGVLLEERRTPATWTEGIVVALAWEGLLEQMVRERYARLVGHAMLLVGSRHDAQDLVQEALLATFASRARFTSIPQAEQYVRRAVVTRSIDES